jgi:hypothetical protein
MREERAPLGAIAQLGERVLCKHEVVGSIPSGSTSGASSTKLMMKLTWPMKLHMTACPANSLQTLRCVCQDFRHREEEVHPIV